MIWLYGSTGAFPIYAQKVGVRGDHRPDRTAQQRGDLPDRLDFFTLRVSRADNADQFDPGAQGQPANHSKVNFPSTPARPCLKRDLHAPEGWATRSSWSANGTANQSQSG